MSYLLRESHLIISIKSDRVHFYKVAPKLGELLEEGDRAAIIFYLKCKGKKRGYVERVENTGADGAPLVDSGPIEIVFVRPDGSAAHEDEQKS